jgi:nitrate reductase cytochrome c-type subunit
MTNDVPTKLLAVMVTMQNYCYKPPIVPSNSKNVQVEKNTNCSKPTNANPVKVWEAPTDLQSSHSNHYRASLLFC